MLLKRVIHFKSYLTFNMMPIIDIVLLLIIFFMFVCRYIAAENFDISVPDEATYALTDETEMPNLITLSVWYDDYEEQLLCAVGSDIIDITDGIDTARLVELINQYCEKLETGSAVINLRMNKDMVFKDYSGIITAVSLSNVKELSIAAMEEKQK